MICADSCCSNLIQFMFIAQQALVILSLFTAGRDEKHFPHPLKVMPERWLRSEKTGDFRAVFEAHATMPFALGNRSCIGRLLALNQMHYITAEVKHSFYESINKK